MPGSRFIAKPIANKDEIICCNHVVVPDFVPNVCPTSKDKSVYIPPYKRNQKVERNVVKSEPPFKSQPKALDDLSLFQLATIVV